jgi:rhamnose utilization protein RhaD (predicted bifunctional aldolase and dehydrogenase)/NAD(P)-dependent dehydrogenase (short-subunit alcohol dehydrogenase family)
MQSRWRDDEAAGFVRRYAQQGVAAELALRVYSSRLLGQEPALVLHGGGNTSVKLRARDLLGEDVDVLCVKGSGWDLEKIEPAGLPAVRLAPLLTLRAREKLSDEEMVQVQRANLLDPGAPNPSVETLLHAFLPGTFIDHTHATAVLSLADQKDGEKLCREVFGKRFGIVPYIMPGFDLAKAAAKAFEADASVEGLVLLKHGIFTFGATAQEAYERMIAAVSAAEARLARGRSSVFDTAKLPARIATAAEIAPILRGACALPDDKIEGAWRRLVLDFRSDAAVLAYVNGAELTRYAQAGVVTPDHTIRTKNYPLILPAPDAGHLAQFRADAKSAAKEFIARYKAYFARHNAKSDPPKRALDPLPRVALVPGLGLFGLGNTKKDAAIAADIALNAIQVIAGAERVGRFESLPEDQLFAMEYWSLEQTKLGKSPPKPLQGQVALITGAAGTIGGAIARLFHANGAELVLLDKDGAAAEALARQLGGALGLACDVTDAKAVEAGFARAAAHFGGVDIVVSNAGAAWQGEIGTVDDAVLRRSFELNFFAHQRVAQAAVKMMREQGMGGALLFNVSKQAVNPGADFGPYGLPKAATLLLVRQYALEYGKHGIRANAVNADRVQGGLLTPELIAARAKARGLDTEKYLRANLLGREVTAEDVAQAFLYHALALKVTGDVTTVDGGNIAAALR